MIAFPYNLIAAGVLALALFGSGWHYGAKSVKAEWDAEKAKQVEATLTVERETRRAFDSIAAASQEKEKNAQVKIDKLKSRVASGDIRLSVRTSSCQPSEASLGHTEGRSELLQADAIAFVGIAGDADRVVRKLNECIDKYNALP